MSEKQRETKAFPALITNADPQTGIVEAVVAVFGNVDMGYDVIMPGAFAKTLVERFNRVRVIDNHNTDSIMRVIGKPLAARELSRAELPAEVLSKAPDAQGGLWTQTQYLLDTPEGAGAFKRIAVGAITEYSFAYDALQVEFVKQGDGSTLRLLKELRLWEYGPVIWGMNPATATVGVKAEDAPEPAPAPEPKVKAGRVLSKVNAEKIRAAVTALSELLEAAFPAEEAAYSEDEEKQVTPPPVGETEPPSTEAGPSAEDTHLLDAKRQALELELQKLGLLLSVEA